MSSSKRRLLDRICPSCGARFSPSSASQRCCDAKCADRYRNGKKQAERLTYNAKFGAKTIVACEWCGKPFLSATNAIICPECREWRRHHDGKTTKKKLVPVKPVKTHPLTVQECERCSICYWRANKGSTGTCDYCSINLRSRGEPVSEHCTKYRPAKGGYRKSVIKLLKEGAGDDDGTDV